VAGAQRYPKRELRAMPTGARSSAETPKDMAASATWVMK